MKVIFCVPTIKKPYQACLDSLKASIPLIQEAGWEEGMVSEVGNPYISAARSYMLHKALHAGADVIVFLDHDLSWRDRDLLTLIETEGAVVAGTYRFKREPEEYMGEPINTPEGKPTYNNGRVLAHSVPAGFLKITRHAVNGFIKAYPELCYGDRCEPKVDLFNHGAHKHVWYGEDYAFSRNWRDAGGELWIQPDLTITHHRDDGESFRGNYYEYLLNLPGGSKSDTPVRPKLPTQIF